MRTPAPIAAFWDWWATQRGHVLALLERGGERGDELSALIAPRVRMLDPELAWELRPGRAATWALCLAPTGDGGRRALTERWYRAAPPADEQFEYHPARIARAPAAASVTLVDGTELALGELRFAAHVDDDRRELDVTAYHPGFAGLPEAGRAKVTALALEWWLGEDAVERWIGAVATTGSAPSDGLPPDALPEVVAGLRQRHREPAWVMVQGEDEAGRPVFATARMPLKWIEAPGSDHHAEVAFPYPCGADGLPADDELQRLYAQEDELLDDLGPDALLAAHMTHAGRRTYHLYFDPEGPVPERLREWADRAEISTEPDPGWHAVDRFRT